MDLEAPGSLVRVALEGMFGAVAEIGAAFLCAEMGLTPEVRPDHASYIASWLTVLKHDKRFIFTAAAHAQRAAEYLRGLQPR